MFNLLPEKYKKQVKSEYKVRRLGVVLAFLFFIQLIALAALFPSYVYSVLNHREISDDLVSLKITDAFQIGEEINERIERINWKSEVLSSWGHNIFARDFIEAVLEQNSGEVDIRQVTINVTSKEEFRVTVSGVAATREDLTSFADRLEEREEFIRAEVPVSDLAQRFNIDFSLEVFGRF